MNADEIVKALRETDVGCGACVGTDYKACGADCSDCAILNAADLIESLQAENARLKQNPKCGEWIKVDQVSVATAERRMNVDRLEEIRQRAEAATPGPWISVADRLPEKFQRVIGYFPSMRNTESEIQITVGWNMDERSAEGGWGAAYWMPLPEPPQKG